MAKVDSVENLQKIKDREDLTPRQETTSPAIAGAKKFLFNSSDPNLDEEKWKTIGKCLVLKIDS